MPVKRRSRQLLVILLRTLQKLASCCASQKLGDDRVGKEPLIGVITELLRLWRRVAYLNRSIRGLGRSRLRFKAPHTRVLVHLGNLATSRERPPFPIQWHEHHAQRLKAQHPKITIGSLLVEQGAVVHVRQRSV